MVCDPVKPPDPPPSVEPFEPEKKKRVRRWHHRGFTGCLTCRRRHVRCDEASPKCKNCTRLSLECDGRQGRMTFKLYGRPPTTVQTPVASKQCGNPTPKSTNKRAKKEDCDDIEGVDVSPAIVDSKPLIIQFENHVPPTDIVRADPEVKSEIEDADMALVPAIDSSSQPCKYEFEHYKPSIFSLNCMEGRYYTHFVDEVATLLLIYDNSSSINPFRRCFPEISQSSPSMAGAMGALGALHLANTSSGRERIVHFQHAIKRYSEVVKSFRTRYNQPGQGCRLQDFATCLLLALYEMMDSQHHNWAIHLKGAREIYRLMFTPINDPTQEMRRVAAMSHPLWKFLVSLLSYLDVAGACATSDGTIVEGSYWRTLGGGWQYNLGIPSLSPEPSSHCTILADLRHCWSILMEIQAAISAFGKAKRCGLMPPDQQDLVYQGLLQRLVQWRVEAPECLQQLAALDDDALSQCFHTDSLEYVGCIEAYEKATHVYLLKIVGVDRPDLQSPNELLAALCTRILNLIRRLARDVGRLAIPWPLYIAGRETWDETEQKFVRGTMIDMQRYGFKNVEKALEELEKAWFKQRAFPEGWVDTMDDVRSCILLP
ncbi:fungal-specific transcription factor domain-containing protein [Aspergillus karnatakaensis]|uniref:Zn(II)2Cys6 transcription factor n=1 Tax=Aspergillus karnatakaensis TaxID=1810916 RepID=UPI003CCDFD1B